jgi:hypothetical protein
MAVRKFLSITQLYIQISSIFLFLTYSGASFGQQSQAVPDKATVPQSAEAVAKPQAPSAAPPKAAAADDLSVEQARLAERFKRLEEVVGRLAELSASSDPRRAKLLREAIAQSREQDVNARFESVVKLLQDERLSAAATNQVELQKQLDALLGLLLKADRDKELASQRERVHKYLKELDRLIRLQRGVRARTDGGDELNSLSEDQKRIAADTGKLNGDITKTDGDKKANSDEPKHQDGSQSSPPDKDPKQTKGSGGEKPKSADQNKSNPNQKDSKSGKDNTPSDAKSGSSSKAQKPSESGKPSEGKSSPAKSSDGQPSNGKSSKSQKSPPSDSPPTPGQQDSQSPKDKDNEDEQRPNEPHDPADRATNRLRAAQQQMDDARTKLQEALRKPAADSQRQAVRELEQAKAELERILRQLREEETERVLTQLAARFRKMLEMQTAVYEATVKLDRVPEAQRTHDHEIEAARQSRQESSIVHEVEKALLVLHEEGSSVAFPEAIEQMRDDMRQITERLAALKVEKITQGLEKDVIAALEETVAALEKAIKDKEKKRTPPGQQGMAGKPEDMSLVDKIAELKMIRSLQMRINKRTQSYGEMIQGEQAETPELLKALDNLAERQKRVYRATADLQRGKNE